MKLGTYYISVNHDKFRIIFGNICDFYNIGWLLRYTKVLDANNMSDNF